MSQFQETKKVADFLSGITDPRLAVSIQIVRSDPVKLEDFEACQQYLGTCLQNLSLSREADARRVAWTEALERNEKSRSDKGVSPKSILKKNPKEKGDNTGGAVALKYYKSRDYAKLTKEQRTSFVPFARNELLQQSPATMQKKSVEAVGFKGGLGSKEDWGWIKVLVGALSLRS